MHKVRSWSCFHSHAICLQQAGLCAALKVTLSFKAYTLCSIC